MQFFSPTTFQKPITMPVSESRKQRFQSAVNRALDVPESQPFKLIVRDERGNNLTVIELDGPFTKAKSAATRAVVGDGRQVFMVAKVQTNAATVPATAPTAPAQGCGSSAREVTVRVIVEQPTR